MTEVTSQHQNDEYVETTSEFIKHLNVYVKDPQKNNEEHIVRLMKYTTRVVKIEKPKEPVENQEDIPKRRGGRPKTDAEPKKYKRYLTLNIKRNVTKKI